MAAHQKKARRLRAHLIFIDESGYSLMPHVARTWGLRGRTPQLKHRCRHRQKVSQIAALTLSPVHRRAGLYWQTHVNTAIDQERVLAFIKHLSRHLRGPMMILWDNINTHRGGRVRDYIARHRRIHAEHLPPYAPDLNPAEWLFEDGKCHELANHGLDDVKELHRKVHKHARKVKRSQKKLRSFIRSSELPLRL